MFKRIRLISSATFLTLICLMGFVICNVKAQSVHPTVPRDIYPYDLVGYTQANHFINLNYHPNYHYHTNMTSHYIRDVVHCEYQDINNARRSEKARPLIYNRYLANLATWRAKQSFKHFSHYYHNRVLAWQDAKKMHLGNNNWSSKNIGENMCSVGVLDQMHETKREAYYYFNNPRALAGDNIFDLVNNDAAEHYAHGINIMSFQNQYFGIGTYYDPQQRVLYILSEFSKHRPAVCSNRSKK